MSLPSDAFVDGALEATGGRGVDIVFDLVGGDAFEGSLRAIAPEGRLLTVGFASGAIPQIPANIVLVKNISVIGINWGYYAGWSPKPPSARAERIVAEAYRSLYGLVHTGMINPRVDQTLNFANYTTGFAAIENRTAIGKVVLIPSA
jgi:NADPH2:quinone reductase